MNTEILEARREAERSLLGAILIESTIGTREAIEAVNKIISPQDILDSRFHRGKHSRIYQAMLSSPTPPHIVAVAEQMAATGTLESGDCAYLRHLIAECPCSLDYEDYAEAVSKLAGESFSDYKSIKGVRSAF